MKRLVLALGVLLGGHAHAARAATSAEAEAACAASPMMEDDGIWRSLVEERMGRAHPAALDQVPREQLAAVFRADAVTDCARALGADRSVLPALMAYKGDAPAWQAAWSALSSVCRYAALPRQRCIDDEVAAFRELRVREAAAPVLAQVVGTCATLMAPHDASMRGAVACADAAERGAPSPGRVSACAVAALTNSGKTALAAGAWLAACYRKAG